MSSSRVEFTSLLVRVSYLEVAFGGLLSALANNKLVSEQYIENMTKILDEMATSLLENLTDFSPEELEKIEENIRVFENHIRNITVA